MIVTLMLIEMFWPHTAGPHQAIVYIGAGRCMHERIMEHDRDIQLSQTKTLAISEHANKTWHHPPWDKKVYWPRPSLVLMLKRLLTLDFTRTTSTGTVDLRFLKRGYLQSNNSQSLQKWTADRGISFLLWQYQQCFGSKPTNHEQGSWYTNH